MVFISDETEKNEKMLAQLLVSEYCKLYDMTPTDLESEMHVQNGRCCKALDARIAHPFSVANLLELVRRIRLRYIELMERARQKQDHFRMRSLSEDAKRFRSRFEECTNAIFPVGVMYPEMMG